ncbi:hypothetical protein C2E23DRAFT_358740 [Lenzites betulinus]|nr:hypothetical protein C2E23DRAFT_358740 [Lenzites betulinus]
MSGTPIQPPAQHNSHPSSSFLCPLSIQPSSPPTTANGPRSPARPSLAPRRTSLLPRASVPLLVDSDGSSIVRTYAQTRRYWRTHPDRDTIYRGLERRGAPLPVDHPTQPSPTHMRLSPRSPTTDRPRPERELHPPPPPAFHAPSGTPRHATCVSLCILHMHSPVRVRSTLHTTSAAELRVPCPRSVLRGVRSEVWSGGLTLCGNVHALQYITVLVHRGFDSSPPRSSTPVPSTLDARSCAPTTSAHGELACDATVTHIYH